MNNVLIIGCGHMGSALLEAWSSNKLYNFIIIDPARYKIINKKFKNKKIQAFKTISQIKDCNIFRLLRDTANSSICFISSSLKYI